MKVKITNPDSTLFEGDVKLIQIPGSNGLFEILDNHAPIISAMTSGTIRLVDLEGAEQTLNIRGGVVKSQKNNIMILVQ